MAKCVDCGVMFSRDRNEKWKVRCLDCFIVFRPDETEQQRSRRIKELKQERALRAKHHLKTKRKQANRVHAELFEKHGENWVVELWKAYPDQYLQPNERKFSTAEELVLGGAV